MGITRSIATVDGKIEHDCTPSQLEVIEAAGSDLEQSVICWELPRDMVANYDVLNLTWKLLASHHAALRTSIRYRNRDESKIYQNHILPGTGDVLLGRLDELPPLEAPPCLAIHGASISLSLILYIHPALLDGTSVKTLIRDFWQILRGDINLRVRPFSSYLLDVNSKDSDSAMTYWRKSMPVPSQTFLHGFTAERDGQFRYTTASNSQLERRELSRLAEETGCPESTIIYAALGLSLWYHGNVGSDGQLVIAVKGRDSSLIASDCLVEKIDQEYPLVTSIDPSCTVRELLRSTQAADTEASAMAWIGTHGIRQATTGEYPNIKISIDHGSQWDLSSSTKDDHDIAIHVSLQEHISIKARHDNRIPSQSIKVILDHFSTALSSMVANPHERLDRIEVISASEKRLIMSVGEAKSRSVADLVHRLVEHQVRLTPRSPAVQFENEEALTFRELDARANRLARILVRKSLPFVPLCMDRSINMILLMYAILKSGSAYVVLDPAVPIERNQFIITDVGSPIVIVDRGNAGRFLREWVIEDLIEHSIVESDEPLSLRTSPKDPVYVIYTSGSTGKPKGALHIHESATSGLAAFPFLPNLRQLFFHNPIFSAAQRSIWSTLKQGGCLCIASKENLTVHINRTINLMEVNVIDVTPSTALLIQPGTVPTLRRMTVAGELINPALVPAWVNELELLNAYGLTENTQVNWRQQLTLDKNPQNIGRPTDTTTSYVLIPGTTRLAPLLVPGELCLGGHQLAIKYLNRPEKTDEVFISNPFGSGRLYRTGDLVLAQPDGSIEMIGRIDFQAKIDGQRVEPGDSNSILQAHPDVYTSAVVSAQVGHRKALVAVVVPKVRSSWPRLHTELRELLGQKLPNYMVPSFWLPITDLPLNVNGKVDIPQLTKSVEKMGRAHLLGAANRFAAEAEPGSELNSAAIKTATTSPQINGTSQMTAVALKLRDIWAEVLMLEPSYISPQDLFQSLGGSSLDAVRVISKCLQSQMKLTVADLLIMPLSKLAKMVQDVHQTNGLHPEQVIVSLPRNAPIEPEEVLDVFPASPIQEAFLADTLRGNTYYIYRRYYRLNGRSSEQVQHALQQLLPSHPVLNSTFITDKRTFLQVILKKPCLSWQEETTTSLGQYSSRSKHVFEFGHSHVHFTHLQDDVLAITIHHALFDHWSNGFLVDDVEAVLRGKVSIARPSARPLVAHIMSQDTAATKTYWQQNFAASPKTLLDRNGSDFVAVFAKAVQGVGDFAKTHRISAGALVFAAWSVVLSLYTKQTDVMFGAMLSGRDSPVPGVLEVAEPTVTTVPFQVKLRTETAAVEFAKQIQEQVWVSSVQGRIGLRRILQYTGISSDDFDTLVNVFIKPEGRKIDHERILQPIPPFEPNFVEQTMLEGGLSDDGLHLRLLSRLPHDLGTTILDKVCFVLETMLIDANVDVMHLRDLAKASDLRPTQTIAPDAPALLAHSLFARMAERHPEKAALVDISGGMTYREFDIASSNFGKVLVGHGIRRGNIVPLLLTKSISTLVAIFGILKVGAAFTPLDPKNSKERNTFVIQDVDAKLLISDGANRHLLSGMDIEIVNMDTAMVASTDVSDAAVGRDLPGPTPEDMAYTIYTSGSTGTPKGVKVSHEAVAASTEGMIEACNVNDKWRALWFLNYVFDASYFDVFTILSTGGTLCIAAQDDLINDLANHIKLFDVQQLMITPTVAKLITPGDAPSLNTLLVCGEPITPHVTEVWASHLDVYNGYGPTEATILMTVARVQPGSNLKSIGRPMKHVTALILSPDGTKQLPIGEIGELCVAGKQVCMGYHKRPDITARSFQELEDGSVVYRTGDLARILANGEIECFGRLDNQVKLNGYRIELGEIENTLYREASEILEACVALVRTGSNEKKQLAVVYVPRSNKTAQAISFLDSATSIDPQILASRLGSLPQYMVPRLFVPVSTMPLLASGKIDRRRIATMLAEADDGQLAAYMALLGSDDAEVTANSSPHEETLRELWAALFDVGADALNPTTSFYQLGGDSITAIQLSATLRKADMIASVDDILANPILRNQAHRIRRGKALVSENVSFTPSVADLHRLAAAGVAEDMIEDMYPCAPGQAEFLTQGQKNEQFWQLMTVRRLPPGFDVDRWVELTRELTRVNQILRSMYVKSDKSQWLQVVLKDPVVDVQYFHSKDETTSSDAIKTQWDGLFQLGRPFVRYLVIVNKDKSMDLVIKLDHAMYDGTLLRIFDEQFCALRDGQALPQIVEFRDFLRHCRQADRQAMLTFWKDMLQDSKFDYPSQLSNPHATGVTSLKIDLPVQAYASSTATTPGTVFQAAYTILLSDLSASSDVLYDYLLTGRNVDMDNPQTINGTCANFLPFRVVVDKNMPVAELLRKTQSLFWKVTENGLVSLGDIHDAMGADRDEAGAKTLFLYQPFEPATGPQDPMRWIVMAMSRVTMHVNYALMLEVFKDVKGNRLKLQFDERVWSKEEAGGIVRRYEEILGRMVVVGGAGVVGECL
ncbi:hypothetical protein BDZ85DRAFT_206290 [Elsinoe ampelina]|uniref:Carrier domain-containing protein n=1 Tax=Elsinoe ampelina TaxID=302913 RepID=A0A6A6G0X3_9PEZI|nr:hypothetical protein BDZ85DRAFT_206290 [Elsinoe ampelina]